jgi:hypothetical protein
MERVDNVYLVEMVYPGQTFHVSNPENPRHLQVRAPNPLWHKENMINLGVRHLLPPDWKAMAWVDADIEFENLSWVDDTLKLLNGFKDVVQLFSHALDMDRNENTMRVFHGFGYQYETGKKYTSTGTNYWHPGFAWACTRNAYERMGGVFDVGVLGSGDNQMALAFIGSDKGVNPAMSPGYRAELLKFVKRVKDLRLGYVPGVIRHYFHGSKVNRKYTDRWKILVRHQFNPRVHVTKDAFGVLVPTPECPLEMLEDIQRYFVERLEDE